MFKIGDRVAGHSMFGTRTGEIVEVRPLQGGYVIRLDVSSRFGSALFFHESELTLLSSPVFNGEVAATLAKLPAICKCGIDRRDCDYHRDP